MQKDIENIIEFGTEGYRVDFKKEQYRLGKDSQKNEFLKDIMAFANQPSDEDKYIIVGVKDIVGVERKIFEVLELTDEAKYQQFLMENIEPKINFEYKAFEFKGNRIAYFRVYDNIQRPYLFKKNVINPITGTVEYKYGDGYIRISTTTTKIGRKEFEDINLVQKRYLDRKLDLDILTITSTPEDNYLNKNNYLFFDIEISNNSNKSISFDVELNVYNNENCTVTLYQALRKAINKRNAKKLNLDERLIEGINPIPEGAKHFSFEMLEEHLSLKRTSSKDKEAIVLLQNSSERFIFDRQVIIIRKSRAIIKAKVIIRSDSFINGALVKEIEVEV